MQAYRADGRRPTEYRWLWHGAVLTTVAAACLAFVQARSGDLDELVSAVPATFLSAPSAPSSEWRSARVPARSTIVRPIEPSVATSAATAAATRWVRSENSTYLMGAAAEDSAIETEIPAGRYLRVLDERPDWLRVGHGTDDNGRPIATGWIARSTVGATIAQPRFVSTLRSTAMFAHDAAGAGIVATVPRLTPLELAGADRNGRVAVRVGDGSRPGQSVAWIDWTDVVPTRVPTLKDSPLDRGFMPFAWNVRLDVPYRTQLDGSISSTANCGPTSVGMALEAYGIFAPTNRLRALALQHMGIYDPWTGTTLESLQYAAEWYGLDGMDLHENGRYRRWTLDDVRRHLRAGHPVIPQLRYRMMPGREWFGVYYDHYVVITGMVGDDFIYNDPIALDGRGERVMSGQALMRAWLASDHPGAGVALGHPARW
jgi:hypothetical protein